MSSLPHDRLLDEAATSSAGTATTVRTTSRRPGRAVRDGARPTVPTQRQGEAQPSEDTTTASTATGNAAAKGSAVARTTTRTKAAAPKAGPTVKVGSVGDAVGGKAAAGKAAAGKAAAGSEAADGTEGADGSTTAATSAAAPAAAADAARTAASDAPIAQDANPTAQPVGEDGSGSARTRGRQQVRSPRRRAALGLAAALLGAAALVSLTPGAPTAQAEAETPDEPRSVSVAEELGIGSGARAVVSEPEAAEQLGELAASRAEREADQVAAAQAQADADRRAAEAAAAAAAAEAARPDAVAPVQGARLTSGFGYRWGSLHAGIDLAAPMRTPEYAVTDGVVLEAGPASGYGLAVYLQLSNGDVAVYGHMEEILVEPGQVVRAGDTIALLGNRGQSTGPHLHLEVHLGGIDGEKVDPVPYLRGLGVSV